MNKSRPVRSQLDKYIYITAALAVLESILLLCTPFVETNGTLPQRIGAYAMAAVFWASVLTEGVFVHITTRARKAIEKDQNIPVSNSPVPGLLSFFKNTEAKVTDALLILAAVVVLVLALARAKTSWLITVSVAALLLLFHLHGILNGNNYRCMKMIRTRKGAK